MKKLAIIMPAYNEERRIGKSLWAYSNYLEGLRNKRELDYSLLVVINNTKDRTEQIVKEIELTNQRINHLNLVQGGKGYAILQGFDYFLKKNFDFIGFVDADMATSPDEFLKLFKNIGKYDGVIASRYIKGAKIIPKPTIQRLLAKRMFNLVVRFFLLLPFEDTQCGAKIFRKEAIEKANNLLTMSQWAFDVELLYVMKKKGFRIMSFPTVWVDKEYSKINFWKAGPWMVLGVLRLRIINSPLKIMIRIYDKLIGFIPK